jgi:serine protease
VIQQSVGVGLALLIAFAPAGRAEGLGKRTAPPLRLPAARAVGSELIVSFNARCTARDRNGVAQSCGALGCREGYGSAYHVMALAPGRAAAQELQRLRRDPRVRFAELDGRVTTLAVATDPYFSPYQWNLADTGFGIHVPSAWDRSTGAGVAVAVVDTGISFETWGGFLQAPDLAATTFLPGWDFIGNDAHPNDDNGHGTHVAGIIAANSNNGYGCAGIAPDCQLMPVKVLGPDGSGPTSKLADGIRYAADHGAQVINVSVGTSQASDALKEAVQYAHSKGIVIVAAAGNDGSDKTVYPAAYPGVISVGATRFDGQRAYYSNYGPTLNVVAPGGDPNVDQNSDGFPDGILEQTFMRDGRGQFGYYFKAGTSQAAPHVTGVAALVLAVQPAFTPDQVEEAIEKTATDLGPPGRDDQYGWGLVNAAAAVNYDPSAPVMNGTLLDVRIDGSQYNFEGGGFQGWNTTDNNRASLFNSTQYAYRGQHSLQVALKGISDYGPGIVRVEPVGGATIPVGHAVTAYIQAVGGGGVAARAVLYDGRGQPIVGSFVPLVPGRWIPVSVTAPASATGPFRWIFVHFRATGAPFTGSCYVDSVSW